MDESELADILSAARSDSSDSVKLQMGLVSSRGKGTLEVRIQNTNRKSGKAALEIGDAAEGGPLKGYDIVLTPDGDTVIRHPMTTARENNTITARVMLGGRVLEKTQRFKVLQSVRIRKPVVLDCDSSKYAGLPKIHLDMEEQVRVGGGFWSGPKDLSAEVCSLWDEQNLYLFCDVKDDTPAHDGRVNYLGDSFELFLGLDAKDPRNPMYLEGDAQISFWPKVGAHPKDEVQIGPQSGEGFKPDAIEMLSRKTQDGYCAEIIIPLRSLPGQFKAEGGRIIRFDAAVNDDDEGTGSRKSQIVWSGTEDNYKSTKDFGYLLFVD